MAADDRGGTRADGDERLGAVLKGGSGKAPSVEVLREVEAIIRSERSSSGETWAQVIG
jgi:hypothetical protein